MALKDLRAELIPLGRAGEMLGKKTAPLDKDEGSCGGKTWSLALLNDGGDEWGEQIGVESAFYYGHETSLDCSPRGAIVVSFVGPEEDFEKRGDGGGGEVCCCESAVSITYPQAARTPRGTPQGTRAVTRDM